MYAVLTLLLLLLVVHGAFVGISGSIT